MVGGKCKSKCLKYSSRSRSRPYYFRRCKSVGPTNIESLPDELLLGILVRLPAAYLHRRARCVCRRWSHIIHSPDFVKAQNDRSTYVLVLSNGGPARTQLLGGQIEIDDSRYKSRSRSACSSNGLIMEIDKDNKRLYVVNPAIKHELALPRCDKPCLEYRIICGIGYAAATNEYKVTIPYGRNMALAILTVGVDKSWRDVEIPPHMLNNRMVHQFLWCHPLTSEGFIHWTAQSCKFVLTLDVETEILTIIHFNHRLAHKAKMTYLSTGRFLSVLVNRRDYSWEVWVLKSGINGEWSKLLSDIDFGLGGLRLQQFGCGEENYILEPLAWVRYPEILAFVYRCRDRSIILYNLATDEISSTDLPNSNGIYNDYVHKHNLIRLT